MTVAVAWELFGALCYNRKSFPLSKTMPVLRPIVSSVLTLALAAPALAVAQTPSLAEIARREQERRKATKSSEKVLTNKDLPASAQAAPPVPAPAAPAGTPPTGAAPASEQKPATDEKDEAWWRERITQAREGLRRSEVFAEALQSRINALSTDFVNRDDPYQRAKIGEDRQKALMELSRVQAEIEGFKKQIEDIEEEARKAGVPPGWLR
jgi:hypothetical protein